MLGNKSHPWIRCVPLAGLLLLLLAAVPTATTAGTGVATELASWSPGRELLERDRFDLARDWFSARLQAAPDDVCAYYFTSLVYTNFDLDGILGSEQAEKGAELIEAGLDRGDKLDAPTPGARYCHGALHGLRAAERLKRSKYLGAALDAKRSRRLMLDLLEDEPNCVDCQFWIGSYDYFADLLPSVMKFFRTLLFFPKGDKQRGLDALQAVADGGELDRFAARWMLISLYSGPERDPAHALELLESVRADYPESFNAALARAWYHFELETPPDRAAGLELHIRLLERAAGLEEPYRARIIRRVRLSLAQAYLSDLQPEKAIETLDPLWPDALEELESAVDVARTRIRALNRAGKHARAVRTFKAVRDRFPDSPAIKGLERYYATYDVHSSRAMAAMMPAWRMGREGRVPEAVAEFERLANEAPLPEIARFGLAHLYFELERYEDALPLFESVGESQLEWPAGFRPLAYLRLGHIHDLAGDRRAAKSAYKTLQKLARKEPGLKALAERYLDRPYDGTYRVSFP
jgi:tetratricopeptide (TPR) repeat protein